MEVLGPQHKMRVIQSFIFAPKHSYFGVGKIALPSWAFDIDKLVYASEVL